MCLQMQNLFAGKNLVTDTLNIIKYLLVKSLWCYSFTSLMLPNFNMELPHIVFSAPISYSISRLNINNIYSRYRWRVKCTIRWKCPHWYWRHLWCYRFDGNIIDSNSKDIFPIHLDAENNDVSLLTTNMWNYNMLL